MMRTLLVMGTMLFFNDSLGTHEALENCKLKRKWEDSHESLASVSKVGQQHTHTHVSLANCCKCFRKCDSVRCERKLWHEETNKSTYFRHTFCHVWFKHFRYLFWLFAKLPQQFPHRMSKMVMHSMACLLHSIRCSLNCLLHSCIQYTPHTPMPATCLNEWNYRKKKKIWKHENDLRLFLFPLQHLPVALLFLLLVSRASPAKHIFAYIIQLSHDVREICFLFSLQKSLKHNAIFYVSFFNLFAMPHTLCRIWTFRFTSFVHLFCFF